MPTGNLLLDRLTTPELEKIRPNLEPVALALRTVIHEPGEPIRYVYFVTDGVVSLVNEPESGEVVEFATIGPEGMAGFPVLLGADTMPARSIVQVPGSALRMATPDLLRACGQGPDLHTLLLRSTMALFNQTAQITSCNRLHEVQERCARWLLQTHDRVRRDDIPLTQEFLAQMLGVHRPTVSIAAGMLQKAGLIEYSRGSIRILSRLGLEAASCPCYRIIKDEYDRLLGADPRP